MRSSFKGPVAQATTKRLSRSWTRHPQRSPLSSCPAASRSTGLGPPPRQGSSTHTWVSLAFPQSRSGRCGSDSVVCLDGSHCAPHGTPHSSDLDTGADSPVLFSLVLSWVTSYPLLYHPLLESLPSY